MSQLDRLEGRHIAQTAHCAVLRAVPMKGTQQEHSKDQGGGRGGPTNASERIFLFSVVSLSLSTLSPFLSKQTQKVQKSPVFQTGAIET